MNKENIFTQDFINHVKKTLEQNCHGAVSIFKPDLVKKIGFNENDPKDMSLGLSLVTSLFELKCFPEYKVLPGKYGGIIHEPTFYRNTVQLFPNGFLSDLFNVLQKFCTEKVPVTRNKIAKQLNYNLTENEICNLITLAMQKKHIVGFKGKVGKNGGIILDTSCKPSLNLENSPSKKADSTFKQQDSIQEFSL
jgi:hypothetical protein